MSAPSSTNVPKKTKVIIAGAGIAGPILGIFLKGELGYDVVIYERNPRGQVGGLSLSAQPNGLRVLDLIPGFIDKIPGHNQRWIRHVSGLPSDSGELAVIDAQEHFERGSIMRGVPRGGFHDVIVAEAEDVYGIAIHYEKQVVDLDQTAEDGQVKVILKDGSSDLGDFVVGCDGLHSDVRRTLFGAEQATFTGLTQTGGRSTKPKTFPENSMLNYYGDGFHVIAYPCGAEEVSWAITERGSEAKETWRALDLEGQEKIRNGPFSQIPESVGELVKSAKWIVKYGLYDRPELSKWYDRRVVLLGDAAHPTSPHLGQGAGQAFEDIYHLVRLLKIQEAKATGPFTTVDYEAVFEAFNTKRRPRTSALVTAARAQGELRVVRGEEACKKRNDIYRESMQPNNELIKRYEETWKEPFTAEDAESDPWKLNAA